VVDVRDDGQVAQAAPRGKVRRPKVGHRFTGWMPGTA
jgi:hypothetical protein